MILKPYLFLAFSVLVFFLSSFNSNAQIERLIIEKYYISGPNDTITFADDIKPLPLNSVTYRVFVDLAEGSKLYELFGTTDHPFIVTSDSLFFNQTKRGQSFGDKINENILDDNTLALDTWLSLGWASRIHAGIPKEYDSDGSIEQIKNNNDGVLKNNNPESGIPLGISDGLLPRVNTYTFVSSGLIDVFSGVDSSIFGNASVKNSLFAENFSFRANEGVTGTSAENIILLAQLTTAGDLKFSFNMTVENSSGTITKYVGKDTLINSANNEQFSSWLTYPIQLRRGCMDPYFSQYDPLAVEDDGSCRDSVIYGCLDPLSCNYNPNANVNLPELCCYDSKCALDLGIVCPGTIYGCMDPLAVNYNPLATATSEKDGCCYIKGCMDKRYKEYNFNACIQDSNSCKLLIIKACMDTAACNYNPFANTPDFIACEYTSCLDETGKKKSKFPDSALLSFEIFPNPAIDELSCTIYLNETSEVSIEIWNIYGRKLENFDLGTVTNLASARINISGFAKGFYFCKVKVNDSYQAKRFIKD